jgi:Leucine-rich repeat (LRR) protein
MIVDVGINIVNPYPIDGRDVRLIIYNDAIGHKLVNSDSWTDLYDIPAGLPINPFKAYAKDDPNREFAGLAEHTENLQIYLPGGNPYVAYAVDASFPGNCAEPYSMENFTQAYLFDNASSTANLSVSVYDWQDDANEVSLYCPWITGVDFVPFNETDPDTWESVLINNVGVPTGEYPGYMVAWSLDSGAQALYDEVKITVTEDFVVTFPDLNLEQAIRDAITKPVGDILFSDLVVLTEFEAVDLSIVNLEGMQYCVNLIDLDLDQNSIVDLNPLAGLNNLLILELNDNQVDDLTPIQNLLQLEELCLYKNQLLDISPIQWLVNLNYLALPSNTISNLAPLQGLSNLNKLFLSHNQISDISPLQNLTGLTLLHLVNNQIVDITLLQGLPNLYNLGLSDNDIVDISALASLTNLSNLYLPNNNIVDITPLQGLTLMNTLELRSNNINDITPLQNLTRMRTLYLETNQISDITPLQGLTQLVYLHLYNNQISDLTPLQGMTLLKNLKLETNLISDISSLEFLTSLVFLHLAHNQISDILPLVNNPGMDSGDNLGLQDNPLSDDSINIYIPELESRGVTVNY